MDRPPDDWHFRSFPKRYGAAMDAWAVWSYIRCVCTKYGGVHTPDRIGTGCGKGYRSIAVKEAER